MPCLGRLGALDLAIDAALLGNDLGELAFHCPALAHVLDLWQTLLDP